MRKQLIKVYVEEQVKAKLEDRAGRESLSSFVSSLIDSYFAEYPGLSTPEEKRMAEQFNELIKTGTVTIKTPPRFKPTDFTFADRTPPTKEEQETVARRLAPFESVRDIPVTKDLTAVCQHNMFKSACPRCKNAVG